MNNITKLVLAGVAVVGTLTVTGVERIGPGYVGIVVNYAGSDRGVSEYPAVTGWQLYNRFRSDVLQYPTFVQTVKWTASKEEGHPVNEEMTFSSSDKMLIGADVSLSYQLAAAQVPNFYVQFRSDNLDTFTHGFLRNVARDAFGSVAPRYTAEELYSGKRSAFLKDVKDAINAQVGKYGVIIDQFGIIGSMRLPGDMVASINNTVKATQEALRVENELKITQAQVAKSVAEAEGSAKARIAEAEGTAKANALLQQSATGVVLELKRLEVQRIAAERWNGELPSHMYGSAAVPFVSVPTGK